MLTLIYNFQAHVVIFITISPVSWVIKVSPHPELGLWCHDWGGHRPPCLSRGRLSGHLGFPRVTPVHCKAPGVGRDWVLRGPGFMACTMTAAEPLPLSHTFDEMASLHERPDRIKEGEGRRYGHRGLARIRSQWLWKVFVGVKRNRFADLPCFLVSWSVGYLDDMDTICCNRKTRDHAWRQQEMCRDTVVCVVNKASLGTYLLNVTT